MARHVSSVGIAFGRKAVALKLDVIDSASFEAFGKSVAAELESTFRRKQFDFLINNAGASLHASIAETTEAQLGGRVRDNPEINKMVASMTALGRVGLPEDIGGAVAMLLAPQSGWINGQRIEASGGMNL